MVRAVQYAHLVGKYVRMERSPKDEVEWLETKDQGDDPKVGVEGTVALVHDQQCVGGWGVAVVMDYGMGYVILEEDATDWRFHIWANEISAKEFRR